MRRTWMSRLIGNERIRGFLRVLGGHRLLQKALTTKDTKVHEGFETRVLLRVLCPEPLSEDIFDLAQQSAALRPVLNVNASFQLLE